VGHATEGTGLESQAGYTLRSEAPVIAEDLRAETRFSPSALLREHGAVSGISTVIPGRQEPFGVLGAHTRERRTFTQNDLNFLQAVANVIAAAVERRRAEEEMRDVREAERARIARDIHDQALQDIVHALAEVELTREEGLPEAGREKLAGALRRSVEGLRAAIFDLRLGEDEGRTFAEQLEDLIQLNRRYAPGLEVELRPDEDLPAGLGKNRETELLRILQEALVNVRRHSGARKVSVTVWASEDTLWAEVSDDGRGFDGDVPFPGTGIRGMRERARALGGNLEVRSEPGGGTTVRFELPLGAEGDGPREVCVLLVDDHASFREAAASVLERAPGFSVVGQAGSLSEARQFLATRRKVDVAIVDLGLPDGYGADLIGELRASNPQAQALVLSAALDRAEVARAVESGAAGVLHKSAGMDEVVDATRRLSAGETLLPLEEVVELLRFAGARKDREYEVRRAIGRLTPREREVLRALAEGLDSEEIAERLNISVKTERNHISSIFAKLGVHSRLQALVFAARYGLVEVG
jgi:DNA-binding NarL/FixJ family response regulator/signal transduction histidine kinase